MSSYSNKNQQNPYCSPPLTPTSRQFSNRSDESTDWSGSFQGSFRDSVIRSNTASYSPNSFLQSGKVLAADQTRPSFVCLYPGCDKYFRRSFDLDRHLKTHFPPSERFECEEGHFCGRYGSPRPDEKKGAFTRKDHYLQHRRDVHMEYIRKGRGSGQVVRGRVREDGWQLKRADTMVRNSQHERTDSEYILRQRQPPERPASKQRRIDANNIAPLKVINMPVPKKFSEQRKKATW